MSKLRRHEFINILQVEVVGLAHELLLGFERSSENTAGEERGESEKCRRWISNVWMECWMALCLRRTKQSGDAGSRCPSQVRVMQRCTGGAAVSGGEWHWPNTR